jgi:hypothetical protein
MATKEQRAQDAFLATLLRDTVELRLKLRWNAFSFGAVALLIASYAFIQPAALWFGLLPGVWARYCWRKWRAAGRRAGWPMDEPVRRAGHVRLASVRRVGPFDRGSILVRFADDAGAWLDLIVPLDRLAKLREILPDRYPEAQIDLDQDLVLPARAVARLGTGHSKGDSDAD